MAATMHAKMNRRKLNKLNIINICEEILNPSAPMALRLSGILMGGVVIVYEPKVKLLYEDLTRLWVEINEAWKVKTVRDPTILPKGKSQAKYEDVTLPDNLPADLGEIEKPLQFSSSETIMGFQKSAYIEMRLDNVEESYISHNPREDQPRDNHQADPANITLFERFDSYKAHPGLFNQFERFDIEGDEETQVNFASHEHTDMPSTLVPSPPPPDEPRISDEIQEQHPEDHAHPQSDEDKAQPNPQRQKPPRRRTRLPTSLIDHEQTMIPGQMYQSWLQKTSDITSRRGRKRKHLGDMRSLKMARLMDLPPVALVCGLITHGNRDVYYPLPLLKLWMRSTQPSHDSPPGTTSPPQPPAPSSSSPPQRKYYHDPTGLPFEEFHSGVGSPSLGVSIEKQRATMNNHEMPNEILMEELRTNLNNGVRVPPEANGVTVAEADLTVTPNNSGDEVRSIPSSDSGHGFATQNSDVYSGRSNKKRLFSSRSGNGLEPVAEEPLWNHPDPNFKLAKLPETALTPEIDLLVETGPSQTQKAPIPEQPMEQLTESIRMQLKKHFDTPGSAQTESLNQLALGLNRKRAACLFYQTCVLASRDCIKVEQKVPYGNILISRGEKMSQDR